MKPEGIEHDIEHERRMAAHHQRWTTRYAMLFSIAGVLAFVVSPWLFSSACVFLLLTSEHREERNRRLDRAKALQ